MLLSKICNEVNKKLAGEMLTYTELVSYLDSAIDDINSQLNSCYPAFSEIDTAVTDYDFFPEKYIRSVVIPGAAWYFYVADEEGSQTALQYNTDFSKGLYLMLRDHLYNIPEEYQADTLQGTVSFKYIQEEGTPGISVDKGAW